MPSTTNNPALKGNASHFRIMLQISVIGLWRGNQRASVGRMHEAGVTPGRPAALATSIKIVLRAVPIKDIRTVAGHGTRRSSRCGPGPADREAVITPSPAILIRSPQPPGLPGVRSALR